MKKNLLPLAILAAAVFLCGADAPNTEAKKVKHNYKTANFFSATGDQTNADTTVDYTSTGGFQNRILYRKIREVTRLIATAL
jgi:hypothetical protein